MPKITIDGKELEFKQGQTIIQAAADHGIDIPHFCYHPKLSVSGNCRICLVEVERMPKLVIACATLASDGMVVHTNSEKTIAARNAVMEFILINHPLDCPICDEAGECKLQDYAYQHSTGESRFVEEKVHKDKRVQLGPHVMFDGERCISCSRCIRFCDEIAKDSELTFVQRGDRVTITTFPGEQLDNPYSMNVVDICPVGALTNSDFRFKARVWDMSHTNSICTGCSRGCNIEIWVRNNEILRLTPRHNEEVNSYWMCDHGRLNTFKFVNASDRIDSPQLRIDGSLKKAEWDEAFSFLSNKLKQFSKNEIAVIGSAYSTCEDNFIVSKFSKSILGTYNVDFIRHIDPSFADDILRTEDLTPNSRGAELVGLIPEKNGLDLNGIIRSIKDGKIKVLYLIEDDILSFDPSLEEHLKKLELFIIHTSNYNRSCDYADVILPAATYAEKNGTFVNIQGRVQRIRPAVATTELDRSMDGMSLSRLDKFGTSFDRWAQGKKYDAKSTWKILTNLSAYFGQKYKYQTSEDVFTDITRNISEFNGLDYENIGLLGKELSSEKVKI
jgi:NADH-quinone oxidoreductase subunit G